jgi:hypothetical protein
MFSSLLIAELIVTKTVGTKVPWHIVKLNHEVCFGT